MELTKIAVSGGARGGRAAALRQAAEYAAGLGYAVLCVPNAAATLDASGLTPEIVFVLRLQDDYQGEKRILWEGNEYHVAFHTSTGDMLRLTAERSNHDGSV